MIQDIFCKIINGELPADKIYEDGDFLVIKDIHPQAPTHLLIVPKKHGNSIHEFQEGEKLLGQGLMLADKVAHEQGLDKGYRLIINEGEHGGKLVPHLHIHLLGGKRLGPKIVKE